MKWDGHFPTNAEIAVEKMREKRNIDRGIRREGSWYPRTDTADDSVWPPKFNPPEFSIMTCLKKLEAFLRKGKLIWLRDYDEAQTLSVAYKNKSGQLVAARFWPNHVMLVLNDDGTTLSKTNNNSDCLYVKHWIWVEETEKVYMLMKNHEVYNAPIET